MKNVELKQQAIAYIEQLSTEKLETALNYLEVLRNSDLWAAEAESEKRNSKEVLRKVYETLNETLTSI